MIVRTWTGDTRKEDTQRYLDYLRETGLAEYRDTPGNLGVLALTAPQDGRTRFLLVSFWESMEAIRAFAGERPEEAVFYPRDDDFLLRRDLIVEHHQMVYQEPAILPIPGS